MRFVVTKHPYTNEVQIGLTRETKTFLKKAAVGLGVGAVLSTPYLYLHLVETGKIRTK